MITKEHKEAFRGGGFVILIMMISWVNICQKHQTEHLKYVHLVVCQLYVNKDVKN